LKRLPGESDESEGELALRRTEQSLRLRLRRLERVGVATVVEGGRIKLRTHERGGAIEEVQGVVGVEVNGAGVKTSRGGVVALRVGGVSFLLPLDGSLKSLPAVQVGVLIDGRNHLHTAQRPPSRRRLPFAVFRRLEMAGRDEVAGEVLVGNVSLARFAENAASLERTIARKDGDSFSVLLRAKMGLEDGEVLEEPPTGGAVRRVARRGDGHARGGGWGATEEEWEGRRKEELERWSGSC
jgi:hypothetical protein